MGYKQKCVLSLFAPWKEIVGNVMLDVDEMVEGNHAHPRLRMNDFYNLFKCAAQGCGRRAAR